MQGYGDVVVVLRRRFCKAEGDDMFMVGHAGQSFRLACLPGKNPRVFRPPAIERPSYGRGCIGGENLCGDRAYCICGGGCSAWRFMRV